MQTANKISLVELAEVTKGWRPRTHRGVVRGGKEVCVSIDAHEHHFNCARTCRQISADMSLKSCSHQPSSQASAQISIADDLQPFFAETTSHLAALSFRIDYWFTVLQLLAAAIIRGQTPLRLHSLVRRQVSQRPIPRRGTQRCASRVPHLLRTYQKEQWAIVQVHSTTKGNRSWASIFAMLSEMQRETDHRAKLGSLPIPPLLASTTQPWPNRVHLRQTQKRLRR